MVTTTRTIRAAAYCRVSTGMQAGERAVSLPTQAQRVARYCDARDYRLVADFHDVMSGRKDDRPGYLDLLRFVEDGGADVVVVQFLDRLGRKPEEVLTRIWALRSKGIAVEVTDEDIGTVEDELLLLLRAAMAGQESKKIGERVRYTMRHAVSERGVKVGRAPYGLRRTYDPETGEQKAWEIDPEQQAVIAEAVRLAVEDNVGFNKIANRLTELGHRSPSGKPWSAESLRVIFRSEHLAGHLVYGKHSKDGEVVRVENYYPKLLAPETWSRLQERLAIRRTAPRGRSHWSDYLLSGLLVCGYCGYKMQAAQSRERRRYACRMRLRNRHACPTPNYHSCDVLERAVLDFLAGMADPAAARKHLAAQDGKKVKALEAEAKTVTKRLRKLDATFDKVMSAYEAGAIDAHELRRRNEPRREEQQRLEARQVELEAELARERNREALGAALPTQIKGFTEAVEMLPVRRAKAMLQTIIETIRVTKEGIEVTFRA